MPGLIMVVMCRFPSPVRWILLFAGWRHYLTWWCLRRTKASCLDQLTQYPIHLCKQHTRYTDVLIHVKPIMPVDQGATLLKACSVTGQRLAMIFGVSTDCGYSQGGRQSSSEPP